MTKIEKVINGLECCMVGDGHSPKCEICPYATVGDDTCQTMDVLFSDAIALLKAQEPVEPIQGRDDQDEDIFCCGVCSAVVGETYLGPPGECEVRDNYCPECGRKVKWNDRT